jgi:hypothetical protein
MCGKCTDDGEDNDEDLSAYEPMVADSIFRQPPHKGIHYVEDLSCCYGEAVELHASVVLLGIVPCHNRE